MGDMGDTFRAMTAHRKQKHADWKEKNTAILVDSGIPFEARPETFLFREDPVKPRVDFYPSTGRWKDIETGKMHSGGAIRFLKWYEKQKG